MKKLIYKLSLFIMFHSCSKKETTPSVLIGQKFLGGVVAYILQPGDPGYDANIQHGLIAATSDISTGIKWNNTSLIATGATATAIGTGLSNTNKIITSQGASTSYAAGISRAYTEGGYSDWFLPSKDELNKLYINKDAIGGFKINNYWSSTEIDLNNAWSQSFNNGSQDNYAKGGTLPCVRAIRYF